MIIFYCVSYGKGSPVDIVVESHVSRSPKVKGKVQKNVKGIVLTEGKVKWVSSPGTTRSSVSIVPATIVSSVGETGNNSPSDTSQRTKNRWWYSVQERKVNAEGRDWIPRLNDSLLGDGRV